MKVQLQDGENGYVASEDIRPAPAALVAEKLRRRPTPRADAGRSRASSLVSTRMTRG